MMPDKFPTYHLSATYADHGELGSYLRSEWGAGRALLRGGDGGARPSRFERIRRLVLPRPAPVADPCSQPLCGQPCVATAPQD